MYRIIYLNKFDYIQKFTGVVIQNKLDRMLIDVNGEDCIIELLKENIIEFELLKKLS